jgi:hypothetical protein
MIGTYRPGSDAFRAFRIPVIMHRLKGSKMRHLILALPAVALFAAAASAQTDTTAGSTPGTDGTTDVGATGGMYGTNWPLSVGTTFLTDADSATLRATEEITSGWQSLSQEDRDMVLADCTTFMAAHGDASAESSTATATDSSTGTSADAGASTDAGATAAGTSESGAATTGTSTGSEAAAAAGYDLAEMRAICQAVDKL